jgi:peroxiredoxin
MALTSSTRPPLCTPAPEFCLPDTHGETVCLERFAGKPLLVAFIANHCPYARHVLPHLLSLMREAQGRGVEAVAISANDPQQHPDDAPPRMAELAQQMGFTVPYLYDAAQQTATAYRAACTPDLFLYDREHRLYYRGRFDDSRPDNDVPVTGEPLRSAIDLLLLGEEAPQPQKPSVGCNIKWKPGNEPDYVKR